MERLTKRINGYAHGAEGRSKDKLTGDYCRGCFEATACIEKLAEYEDLEEQGKLLKLPCAVGDIVYAIEADEENFEHFYCGMKISELQFDYWMIPLFEKCIFLTKSAAEQALKEMEGKNENE